MEQSERLHLIGSVPLADSEQVFRRLSAEGPAELASVFTFAVRRAEQDREIIECFGRFPQRNSALGRLSTAEEAAWLSGEGAAASH